MNTRNVVTVAVAGVVLAILAAGTVVLSRSLKPCRPTTFPPIEVANVTATEHFSSSYVEARAKFLEAAQAAGGNVTSLENPDRGPGGERLFTDVALFGTPGAKRILVLGSGTHGVEGFAGSGVQTGLLREGIASHVHSGMNIVMIHAINPYGMAHLRRFNEDNVDLNRNFVDHAEPASPNPGYEALASMIAPRSMSFWSEAVSWIRFFWNVIRNGRTGVTQAVTGAQYTHPKGLFYGGTFAAWSNQTIRSIAERHLSNADRIVIVDFHTGLGSFGNAEIILNSPEDSPAYERSVAIWGPEQVKSTVTGESASTHLGATLKLAFPEMLPNSEVTAVSLEYGTVPILEVFKALRAENWLHHHGGPDHPRAREIKSCLLRAFHPQSDEWEASVWKQGKEVVEQALDWLNHSTG